MTPAQRDNQVKRSTSRAATQEGSTADKIFSEDVRPSFRMVLLRKDLLFLRPVVEFLLKGSERHDSVTKNLIVEIRKFEL